MSNIPTDVFRYIISFIGDIELSRCFGFYEKIDIKRYSILNTITRKIDPRGHREFPNYIYRRYELCNIYDIPTREEQKIDNDSIEMKVAIYNGKVMYNYGIYRLKSENKEKTAPELSYKYKGDLIDYYWDYLLYSFDLI